MKSTIQTSRGRHAQFGMKQFRAAESEQDHRQQIGGGADHQVGKAGDDRSERADEILRRPVWRERCG